MTNIATVLTDRAAEMPNADAIRQVIGGRTRATTFGELEAMTCSVAEQLRANGLRPGDDVLLLIPIRAELYAVLLAPSAGLDHAARCCGLRPPRAFIGSGKAHLLRLASAALRAIPLKFAVDTWVPGARRLRTTSGITSAETHTVFEEHPALLTFTSGGTGLPKAAVRTHGFLLSQNRVLARTLQLQPGEIDLATLPVFVLANLAAGVTTIIPDCDLRYPGRIDATKVLAQIADEQPTSTACSPAFIERLARAALDRQQPLTSFRRIYTGGAPVTAALMDLIAEAAPAADVVAVYGSTEAEPIAELSLREMTDDDRANSATGGGLPAGHYVDEIRLAVIRDSWGTPLGQLSRDEFASLQLSPGDRGEIVVSGDHVLKGYLDGRGDEETKFDVDGVRWHRTGDAGYLDAQNNVWLLGRCASVVRDARGTLYPFAVEVAAAQHPAIARAALLQHQDQRLLFAQLKPGHESVSDADLLRPVAWATLDRIIRVEQLPVDRRHNAKIDYPRLRELAGKLSR